MRFSLSFLCSDTALSTHRLFLIHLNLRVFFPNLAFNVFIWHYLLLWSKLTFFFFFFFLILDYALNTTILNSKVVIQTSITLTHPGFICKFYAFTL